MLRVQEACFCWKGDWSSSVSKVDGCLDSDGGETGPDKERGADIMPQKEDLVHCGGKGDDAVARRMFETVPTGL